MSHNPGHCPTSHGTIMTSLYLAEADAARGSEALRHAMEREFMGLALRHGMTLADARLMLMNAVSPVGRRR